MTSFSTTNLVTCLFPAFLFLSSCEEKKVVEMVPAETQSVAPFFTASRPADPQAISAIRTVAKPGDEVTIFGLVMGREKPFVEGRAAFVLGDPSKLTPCNKMPDDHCETPWDACCDSPEAKREGTATIQLIGLDQRVIKRSLKGEHGLKELSNVTLTGTVDKTSTPDALIINATALHVTE